MTVVPFRPLARRVKELSDEALVAACGIDDPVALGTLFDRHHLRVHRFLCRVGGVTAGDAEDLLQDTFTAVWISAHRYQNQAPALTWIFGIAANVARNHLRGKRRNAQALKVLADRPPAAVERADDVTERRELLRRLQAGLAALSHDQRVAWVMCELEDVSGVDAAAALGVRPGTVWRWLHEARKNLRAALSGEER